MAGLVRDVRRKLEATSNAFRNWRTQFGFLLLLSVNATVTWAEAVLDGTRGSTGSYSGHFTISEDFGETSPDGKNLFHSFSVFNINAGESATFTGSDSINNVISRVTGSSGTTINGPLISEIANADFYFINPKHILL